MTGHGAAGPVLKAGTQILWKALEHSPGAENMPGRLVMQNDGNLVYYNPNNVALWATDTGNSAGAPSVLRIKGSYADKTLKLYVADYAVNQIIVNLYKQN